MRSPAFLSSPTFLLFPTPQNSYGPLPKVPHPPALGHFLYTFTRHNRVHCPFLGIPCSHWEKAPLTFLLCQQPPVPTFNAASVTLPFNHNSLYVSLLPTVALYRRDASSSWLHLMHPFTEQVMEFMLFILRSNERTGGSTRKDERLSPLL